MQNVGAGPVPAVQSRLGRSMPTTSTPSTAPPDVERTVSGDLDLVRYCGFDRGGVFGDVCGCLHAVSQGRVHQAQDVQVTFA